jgi:hypothetical protein
VGILSDWDGSVYLQYAFAAASNIGHHMSFLRPYKDNKFMSQPMSTEQTIKLATILGTFLLGGLFVFSALLGKKLLDFFYLSSDGFHYFSVLRNFWRYGSFWEGPTFEYLLGNHAFISMYALTPFIGLFESVYVLVIANLLSHFIAAYLIALSGEQLFQKGSVIPWALSFFYLIQPTVIDGLYANGYIFAPDYWMSLMVVAIFYCCISGKLKTIFSLIPLIVLTKEEYVLTLPFILIFIFFCCFYILRIRKISLKFIYIYSFSYVVSALTSILVLFFFRSLLDNSHVARPFQLGLLLLPERWLEVFVVSLPFMYMLAPFVMIGMFLAQRKKVLILGLATYTLIFSRLLLNLVIYGSAQTYIPWSSAILAPILVIGVTCIAYYIRPLKLFLLPTFISALVAFVYLSHMQTTHWFYNYIKGDLIPQVNNSNELAYIQESLNLPISDRSYVVTSEKIMLPFLKQRSHVVLNWALIQDIKTQEKIFKKADYIIVQNSFTGIEKISRQFDLEIFIKSNNFTVFIPTLSDLSSKK